MAPRGRNRNPTPATRRKSEVAVGLVAGAAALTYIAVEPGAPEVLLAAALGGVLGLALHRLSGSPWAAGVVLLLVVGLLGFSGISQAAAIVWVGAFGAGYFLARGLSPRPVPGQAGPPIAERGLPAYAAALVERDPEPPRSFDAALLRRLARRSSLLVYVAMGIGGAVVLYFFTGPVARLPREGALQEVVFWAFIAFGSAGVLMAVLGPELEYRRARLALERGLRARAEVIEFAYEENDADAGYYPAPTLRARCRVGHPLGAFTTRLTDYGPGQAGWGRELDRGADLAVLTHPERRKVLLWLGPTPRAREEDIGPAGDPVPRDGGVGRA